MKKGDIVKGRVTAIKPYGAFVKIDEDTDGLVHISEISVHYVNRIEDHLTIGRIYEFEVISAEKGKISLSLKRRKKKKKRLDIRLKSGFEPLREALEYWIENYEKRSYRD